MKKYIYVVIIVFFISVCVSILINLQAKAHQINQWRFVIDDIIVKEQMQDYRTYIYGILLTESHGQERDLMQSSESKYGTTNKVENEIESIEIGIHYLKYLIEQASEQDTDIWTAIQAYNFGENYISYVANHGGKTNIYLAEQYSKNVLAPYLGNQTEYAYRYWNVQSIFYNGGYLYHNGGNFFYADLVKKNMWLINTFHWIDE